MAWWSATMMAGTWGMEWWGKGSTTSLAPPPPQGSSNRANGSGGETSSAGLASLALLAAGGVGEAEVGAEATRAGLFSPLLASWRWWRQCRGGKWGWDTGGG